MFVGESSGQKTKHSKSKNDEVKTIMQEWQEKLSKNVQLRILLAMRTSSSIWKYNERSETITVVLDKTCLIPYPKLIDQIPQILLFIQLEFVERIVIKTWEIHCDITKGHDRIQNGYSLPLSIC